MILCKNFFRLHAWPTNLKIDLTTLISEWQQKPKPEVEHFRMCAANQAYNDKKTALHSFSVLITDAVFTMNHSMKHERRDTLYRYY
jgi:hypothetical protein